MYNTFQPLSSLMSFLGKRIKINSTKFSMGTLLLLLMYQTIKDGLIVEWGGGGVMNICCQVISKHSVLAPTCSLNFRVSPEGSIRRTHTPLLIINVEIQARTFRPTDLACLCAAVDMAAFNRSRQAWPWLLKSGATHFTSELLLSHGYCTFTLCFLI